MTGREVYLDYAAATPVDSEVAAAMAPYLTERFWNPSAPYSRAREVRDDVERARGSIARALGARPDCLTFTAGATEANNLAFAAVEGHVVVDAIEHESVLACAATHARRTVRVGTDGLVDPAVVARAIRPETELVSVELANGEIGCVQPVREIARAVAAERARRLEAGERTPIYLHSDASQAAGALSVNVSSLGVDMLTLSAAKLYGPKQVGVLGLGGRAPASVRLWGRAGGRRALRHGERRGDRGDGPGPRARARAPCERVGAPHRPARAPALPVLQLVPWAHVSGPRNPKRRLPGLLSVSFAGIEARRLVIALEREGVFVGTGSACAASRMRVSHVLEAIGMPRELAEGSLRLTLGRPTTEEDVDHAAEAICRAVRAEATRLGLDDASQTARVAALLGSWR